MHKNKVHTQSFFPPKSGALYKPLSPKILHLIETSFLQLYVSLPSTGYATDIQQGSGLQWASPGPSQTVLGKVIAHFSAQNKKFHKIGNLSGKAETDKGSTLVQ